VAIDVLIDGYNLLHAAGLAKAKYAPGELERRRARLLAKLRDLLDPAQLPRTTVVFDARINPPPDRPDPPSGPITVIFAPRDREADDVVEELLAKHSVPQQVLVVSSDHRLHKAARRRGATAVDSEEFLDELEVDHHVRATNPPPVTPNRQLPPPRKDSLEADLEAHAAGGFLEKPEPPQPNTDTEASGSGPRDTDPLNDPGFWERRIQETDP